MRNSSSLGRLILFHLAAHFISFVTSSILFLVSNHLGDSGKNLHEAMVDHHCLKYSYIMRRLCKSTNHMKTRMNAYGILIAICMLCQSRRPYATTENNVTPIPYATQYMLPIVALYFAEHTSVTDSMH